MNGKVLVTGAAGFIGSNICERLHIDGWSVVGMDNLSHGRIENLARLVGSEGFEYVNADVRDVDSMMKAAVDAKAIIHLASYKIPRYGHVEDTLSVNLEGTEAVLEAARQYGAKVLYASTEDVYGKNSDLPLSEESELVLGGPASSRWSDAVSKICAEQLCYAYSEAHGVIFTILRFGNLYGPYNRIDWWGGVPGVFIDRALRKEKIPIHGNGTQFRAFLYIDDAVEAITKILESPNVTGEVINIGSDEPIRVINLAYLVWRLSGNEGKPDFEFIPYEDLSPNYEDVKRRILDISKARFLLDFMPTCDLKTGISKTIAWQRELQG
jgi:UDP-glucose 4-epimerase